MSASPPAPGWWQAPDGGWHPPAPPVDERHFYECPTCHKEVAIAGDVMSARCPYCRDVTSWVRCTSCRATHTVSQTERFFRCPETQELLPNPAYPLPVGGPSRGERQRVAIRMATAIIVLGVVLIVAGILFAIIDSSTYHSCLQGVGGQFGLCRRSSIEWYAIGSGFTFVVIGGIWRPLAKASS